MNFFLFANCFMILFTHRGDGARTATVTLFDNNSNMLGGALIISQFNSTEPVMITGLVNGPNITANTSYVRSFTDETINQISFFLGFSCP